jgi:tetratricopeptide (TPR) repeat protein
MGVDAMNTRKKLAIACAVIVFLAMALLFFTRPGLRFQYLTVEKKTQCPQSYSRFLAYRLSATGDPLCRRYAAELLSYVARINLDGARDVLSEAIQQEPDAKKYRFRADIYMCRKDYTNAVADYEQAITLWDPRDWTGDFSIHNVSNSLEIARACAQIRSNQTARAK